MRNLIEKLNQEWGLTILLATHGLHEIQELCATVAVLQQGQLIFQGAWQTAPAQTLEEFYLETVRAAQRPPGLAV